MLDKKVPACLGYALESVDRHDSLDPNLPGLISWGHIALIIDVLMFHN